MPDAQTTVRRHPVASFFVIAYLFSWIIWAPTFLLPAELGGDTSADRLAIFSAILLYLGTFGAPVAAIAVLRLSGGNIRRWARQIVKWRVAPKWWLAAFGLPILGTVLVSGIYILVGGSYDLSRLAPFELFFPLFVFAIFLSGGLNEEPGWRGFALPLLQERYSALTSSVILGVLWGVWHLPLFFAPIAPQSAWPLANQLLYLPSIVLMSILLTWLYNSSASVLLVMVLHAAANIVETWVPFDPDAILVNGTVDETSIVLVGIIHIAVYLGFVLVVVGLYGSTTLSPDDVPTREVTGLPPEM